MPFRSKKIANFALIFVFEYMRFKTIIIAAVLAVLAVPFAGAAELLGFDGEESTSVGIYIKDLSTGRVLIDRNSQLALTPASVLKAVTSATALSINGADARFTTKVVLRGAMKGAGVFGGDIVVRASADPTLESENFKANRGFCDSIVANLRRRGIKKIEGAVVVRQTLKDSGPLLTWEVEDLAWPYGAGLFGFNYRDNTATVWPNTGKTRPEVPGLEICVNKIPEGRNDLVRGIGSNRLMVYTRNTADTKWALNTTVPDPAAVFVCELTKKLAEAGISVGKKALGKGEEKPLYTHRSPRYAEILKSLMVRSDNLFAEGVLRNIEPAATRKQTINRERELWATRGINTRYTIINDGSGLSRSNRLSAHFLGDVLEWMAASEYSAVYATFFPRVGKEGTVRGFLDKTPLTGCIGLKTGSVSSVQCYAGYRFDADDKPTHVVVIMVNGFFCPRRQVREAAENLLLDVFK